MARSGRELCQEMVVKGRRRKGGGCASLIEISSYERETLNGRKHTSSSCQVGREDSLLFCKSVSQKCKAISYLAFVWLSGMNPGGLASLLLSALGQRTTWWHESHQATRLLGRTPPVE